MNGTIIQSGSFTSDGSAKTLQIRSGIDWMRTLNYTQILAQTASTGYEFYWQNGMANGYGIEYKSNAGSTAVNTQVITSNGFTLVDSSANPNGALNNGSTAITAVSNAAIPVVTCGSTAGMPAGSVVRLINITGAHQFDGIDFTIGYNTLSGTTFSLDYAPQIVAGTAGSFRQIKFDPLFYPRRRTISKITRGTTTTIYMTVTHGYKVGQVVRFHVPSAYGTIELDNLQGTILSVDTTTTTGNSITVDIDSSSFTAFAFPLTAAPYTTPAEVVPVGEDTGVALSSNVDILSDATTNTGYIGMYLGAGAQAPAGQANDLIYWVAGKTL